MCGVCGLLLRVVVNENVQCARTLHDGLESGISVLFYFNLTHTHSLIFCMHNLLLILHHVLLYCV